MINPQELRIGNLVGFYKPHLPDIQTGTITEIAIPENEVNYFLTIPEFSKHNIPIPIGAVLGIELTEEWMLRCDFKKRKCSGHLEENYEYEKDGICFSCEAIKNDPTIFYPYIYSEDEFIVFSFKPIKYLHKLQNFYYEIKNEELIIKTGD